MMQMWFLAKGLKDSQCHVADILSWNEEVSPKSKDFIYVSK